MFQEDFVAVARNAGPVPEGLAIGAKGIRGWDHSGTSATILGRKKPPYQHWLTPNVRYFTVSASEYDGLVYSEENLWPSHAGSCFAPPRCCRSLAWASPMRK